MENATADDVKAAVRGELGAFERLAERHKDGIYGLCYTLVGNFQDAEELAQETLIRAFVKLDSLKRPGSFAAWLTRIARNICRDWLRSKARREERECALSPDSMKGFPAPEDTGSVDARDAVDRAFASLPQDQREATSLYYINGYSYDEVAQFLGTTRAAVKGRIQRGRARLKEELIEMVAEQFAGKQLRADFTQQVLSQIVERAKRAHQRWDAVELQSARQDAEAPLASVDDDSARANEVELFRVLGDAATTWLGEPRHGMEHYRRALKAALAIEGAAPRSAILRAMVLACLRHGRYEECKSVVQEALTAFDQANDVLGAAMMSGAAELARLLPSLWRPGKEGGFSFGVFPVETCRAGIRILEPRGERELTWGCPPRCAAFAFLYYPRRLLSAAPTVGAQWRDGIEPQRVYFGWPLGHRGRSGGLRAVSRVESNHDTISTLAGRFQNCLRVSTRIYSLGGSGGTDHVQRTLSGTRISWFAPGVGLVKLRHEDQNGQKQIVYLAAHSGRSREGDYFPLDEGKQWHYRWWEAFNGAFFDDVCTVVTREGETAFIASAVAAARPSDRKIDAFFQDTIRVEKSSGDLRDVVASLDATLNSLRGGAQKALKHRLARLLRKAGGKQPEEAPAHEDKRQPIRPPSEQLVKNIHDFEEAGRRHIALGDLQMAAVCFSVVLKLGELLQNPDLSEQDMAQGEVELEVSRINLSSRGSGGGSDPDWLGRKSDSPFDSIARLGVPDIKLPSKAGQETFHHTNFGTEVGTEPFKTRSTVVKTDASVKLPAGEFDGCLLVGSTITCSRENHLFGHKDRERTRGFLAGTRHTWFAPGVGLVRIRYAHANGLVTDVNLVNYTIRRRSRQYFPCAVGNSWRYRWKDPGGGIHFEEVRQVVARKRHRVVLASAVSALPKDSRTMHGPAEPKSI